ncbi:MAG: hypothetical protein PSU94_14745 [Lacunisphaera sp.]|nr:hypothetical protein [Lacunisphaera sp.]
MTKSSLPATTSPCGCLNCLCHRGPRCRCHAYNTLLALAFWDFGRVLRRRRSSA